MSNTVSRELTLLSLKHPYEVVLQCTINTSFLCINQNSILRALCPSVPVGIFQLCLVVILPFLHSVFLHFVFLSFLGEAVFSICFFPPFPAPLHPFTPLFQNPCMCEACHLICLINLFYSLFRLLFSFLSIFYTHSPFFPHLLSSTLSSILSTSPFVFFIYAFLLTFLVTQWSLSSVLHSLYCCCMH